MITGRFPDYLQEWYLKNLDSAKEVLNEFELLNALFDEFKGYEKKPYKKVENIVLRSCLPKISGNADYDKLNEIEKSIKLFDLMKLSSGKFNGFKSRLCSDKYNDSVSVCSELMIANHLVDIFNIENVKLYPTLQGGGLSDILVKLNDKSVYIEVGNLDDSKPEKRILNIVQGAAECIGKKFEQQHITCFLHIEIDTAEFIFDKNGYIDIDNSTSKLISEFESIQKSVDFKKSLDIDKDYLIKNGIKLITFINVTQYSLLFVSIQTEASFRSKAASLEQESFINHIIRNIKGQLKEEQIQPEEPNIIIIQGHNWTVFVMDEIKPLLSEIRRFFEERHEKYLSGIAIFGDDFNNTFYINNEHSIESSKLSQSEITRLGFRWF